jgi:ribosomal protein L16 Arg81 hydroxylase
MSIDARKYVTFDSVIAPCSIEKFVEEFWEKQPLHLSRGDARYSSLCDLQGFEDLIRFGNPLEALHDLVAIKCMLGDELEEKYYLGSEEKDLWMKVYNLHSSGFSFIYNRVEKRSNPIARTIKSFERFFGYYCTASLFLSPQRPCKGTLRHYDGVEIFALQLQGKKVWSIYKPQYELPHTVLPAPKVDDKNLEVWGQIIMQPGDLLYLPRGYIHDVNQEDADPSLHLTIMVEPCRWMDMLLEGVQQFARRESALRGSVKLLGEIAQLESTSPKQQFYDKLRMLIEKVDFEQVRSYVEREICLRTDPLPSNFFATEKQHIDCNSLCRVRKDILFSLGRLTNPNLDDFLALTYSGNTLYLTDPKQQQMLDRILSREPFTPLELPGNLPLDEKVSLCKKLIEQGLMILCEQDDSS